MPCESGALHGPLTGSARNRVLVPFAFGRRQLARRRRDCYPLSGLLEQIGNLLQSRIELVQLRQTRTVNSSLCARVRDSSSYVRLLFLRVDRLTDRYTA